MAPITWKVRPRVKIVKGKVKYDFCYATTLLRRQPVHIRARCNESGRKNAALDQCRGFPSDRPRTASIPVCNPYLRANTSTCIDANVGVATSHLHVSPWRNNPHLVQYVDPMDVRRTARTHLGTAVFFFATTSLRELVPD